MTLAKRAYTAVERNPMQAIGWVLAFALIIILGLRGESTRDIVTASPCNADPNGAKCQTAKRESDEERSVPSTCVLFYKVDKGGKLLKLTKCEVKGRPPGTRGTIEPGEPAGRADATAAAPVAPGTRHDHVPSKGGGGKPSAHGKGGSADSGRPPASGTPPLPPPSAPPASDPAAATSSPGNSEGNGSSDSSKANPVAEGAGKAVEDVGAAFGEVVKETGKTVNGAVEGVTGKACGLVGASC